VRFRRLHARVFGPLRDRDFDLDADVILVFGHNESGKSSFRSALETIAYGFDPAAREAHPLYRWDGGSGGDLQLEAELELDGGSVLRVERVLQATGKSRTAGVGEPFQGKRGSNAPLGPVGELPRGVFRSLYSLEAAQLEALQRGVSKHVDDLLLPEAAALDLRPVSEVREELRSEAQGIWRSDRRGEPEVKRLRERLSAARNRADRAARAERELRDARAERDERTRALAGLEDRRRALERERDGAPYLEKLFELSQRRRKLGEPVDLTPLGELSLVAPEDLSDEVEELEASLREPAARLERPPESLGEREEAVLAVAPDVELALASAAEHAADRSRLAEVEKRAARLRDEALRELGGVLAGPPSAEALEVAGAVPLEAMRAAQARWAANWEEHASAPGTAGARLRAAALAAGVLGLVLAVLPWLGVVDPALGAVGALLLFGALLVRGRVTRDSGAPPVRPSEIDGALEGLSVSAGLLAGPADLQRLLDALARVQASLAQAGEAGASATALRRGLEGREVEWSELCRRLGLDMEGSGEQRLARLRAALAGAREAEKRVERDRGERALAQQAVDATTPALERKGDHLRRVERTLAAAEPAAGSRDEAYASVKRRMREAEFLREWEAQLRADTRWSALSGDPRARAEDLPEDAPWLPEIAARREDEIAECEREIAAANTRLGELSHMLGSDEGSQQAQAGDEVCALEEEIRGAEQRRDRLALLESILQRAERDYREEHQPDVMRRASAYLERLTRGRYSRLDFLDGDDGGLHATCSGLAEPVPVGEPLSRGTLDQIFLCLRLGLLDHLDRDRERLPLVLDDVLVRTDGPRRTEIYPLLAEVSRVRQLFLLTCQEALADEAEGALKPRRIDLTG
jgi:uncharacterized protein YhaN